jgi:hypothetical protein
MKRVTGRALRLLVVLTLAVSGAFFAPTAAQARPSGCTYREEYGRGGGAAIFCRRGTGYFRAFAECAFEPRPDGVRYYGSWRYVGQTQSVVWCPLDMYFVYGSYELR